MGKFANVCHKMNPAGVIDDVIKEGNLNKQSKFWKTWRQRWFVLTPTCIYSFKAEKTYKDPTEVIPLKDCSTIKSAEDEVHKEFAFRIDCKDRTFYLTASSATEKESWIGAIGKAMVKLSARRNSEEES
eukprot:TRINITY_DN1807_c0_g1_i1.p1 TRINITY_DN1807_c0_g1~~TRINITY_DN1807_c0_g1_i1.p1  ORF type:complete len:129 (-),score=29.22 TRINITY_DN1807_c0_g1_i1:132-518(-)